MPRGDNPNSRANLTRKSSEEARKLGAKGGKASGEARRALKTFKELDDEFTTDLERKKMLEMLKKRAIQGNLKALEIYRDTMGMKPIDKINVAQVDQESIDGLKEAIAIRRSNGADKG